MFAALKQEREIVRLAGSSTGVMAEVPYTTEYYFYRARN